VSVASIQTANNIQGETIFPDDVLIIYLTEDAVVALTATPEPTEEGEGDGVIHEVKAGDTLSEIAVQYGVTVDALKAANDLDSDTIRVGQELVIPGTGTTPTPAAGKTPTPDTSSIRLWQPAILEGDLQAAYPNVYKADRFTVHYAPNTRPAQEIEVVQGMVAGGLAHIEARLQATLEGTFDVYVAGELFASPDTALRGRSFSTARRYFFLHDGMGNAADQQYIATHELTHLFAWNVFGKPVSAMLSEGVAVYTGITHIAGSDHMAIDMFCAAYHQAGVLPRVSENLRFEGHIYDLQNYYAAGCFVQYLIQTYGPAKFGELYATGNYASIYGKSLKTLEEAWITSIEFANIEVPFESEALIASVDAVGAAYTALFDDFDGTPSQMAAYQSLDAARIAMLEGDFDSVDQRLAEFRQKFES
jgi:LysM repeat protein